MIGGVKRWDITRRVKGHWTMGQAKFATSQTVVELWLGRRIQFTQAQVVTICWLLFKIMQARFRQVRSRRTAGNSLLETNLSSATRTTSETKTTVYIVISQPSASTWPRLWNKTLSKPCLPYRSHTWPSKRPLQSSHKTIQWSGNSAEAKNAT